MTAAEKKAAIEAELGRITKKVGTVAEVARFADAMWNVAVMFVVASLLTGLANRLILPDLFFWLYVLFMIVWFVARIVVGYMNADLTFRLKVCVDEAERLNKMLEDENKSK